MRKIHPHGVFRFIADYDLTIVGFCTLMRGPALSHCSTISGYFHFGFVLLI
jgi:hypothetical protein